MKTTSFIKPCLDETLMKFDETLFGLFLRQFAPKPLENTSGHQKRSRTWVVIQKEPQQQVFTPKVSAHTAFPDTDRPTAGVVARTAAQTAFEGNAACLCLQTGVPCRRGDMASSSGDRRMLAQQSLPHPCGHRSHPRKVSINLSRTPVIISLAPYACPMSLAPHKSLPHPSGRNGRNRDTFYIICIRMCLVLDSTAKLRHVCSLVPLLPASPCMCDTESGQSQNPPNGPLGSQQHHVQTSEASSRSAGR